LVAIFWRGPPEFWNLHYKIHEVSDHVAKFHDDRLRVLEDFVAKEIKKTSV